VSGLQTSGRFAGRAAIVTGGSSGIGRAIAHRLTSEGASACLVAAPQDAEALEGVVQELRSAGRSAVGLAADIGVPETAAEAVRLTREHFGRVDHLANNAGITYFDDVFEAPLEHFDHTMHVNVRGMYLMALEAARAMSEDGGGSIVCTASTASWVGEEYQAIYHISKGAVSQLIRALAVDMAPYGVRVNGLAPGSVLTPVVQAIVAQPQEWAKFRVHVPMDRAAEPEEIAAPIAFLLSDEASYITGTILTADGGLTAGFRMSGWDAQMHHDGVRPQRRPPARKDPDDAGE
jgi:NAD(P)-dependent dehydrogenase (short-subunit alcohol dehydrogenase family)